MSLQALLQLSVVVLMAVGYVLQIQSHVLYQRFQVSFASIQMHITAGQTFLQASSSRGRSRGGTPVLSPCHCTAYLDMHRVSGDAQLPDTKALVNLDAVDVQLTPEAITILGDALHQPAASQGGQEESPSKGAGQPAEVMTSGGYSDLLHIWLVKMKQLNGPLLHIVMKDV